MGLDFFSKVRIFTRSWNVLKNWYVYPLVYFNLTKKPHVIFETKSGIKLKIRTRTTDLMALTNVWLIQEYLNDEFNLVTKPLLDEVELSCEARILRSIGKPELLEKIA